MTTPSPDSASLKISKWNGEYMPFDIMTSELFAATIVLTRKGYVMRYLVIAAAMLLASSFSVLANQNRS